MSKGKGSAIAIGAVLFGAMLGYGIASYRMAHSPEQAAAPAGEGEVLYWHDPMVPGVRFDKPGKSPFMDMQLVPVYADGGAGGDVRIPANVMQNLGIRLGKVEKRTLSQQFDAVGSVAFDERLLEVVQARVTGYVTRLHVKAPLERVQRGQPLAEILAPEWLAAQQDYIALLDAQSASSRPILEAARERLLVLGVPDATIRALEKDRKTRPTTTIFAPIDGVVTELTVRAGATFMAGAPLVRINGLSTVWVNAQVPENQVSLATSGASVEARTGAWPAETFDGELLAILPEVDMLTRTLPVRLALDNPENKLSPGMFVTLRFAGPEAPPQLVVPSEAVIVTGRRSVVIVARENGGFEVAEVRIGAERDGLSAVLSGLEEGQSIVVSGQFLIDSEASLKSTVDRLTSTQPPAPDEPRDASAPGTTHLAEGTVTAISPTEITIAHGPVPSLQWGAMTMPFGLPAAGLPEDVAVGTRVSFSFSSGAGGFQVERIAAIDESAGRAQP